MSDSVIQGRRMSGELGNVTKGRKLCVQVKEALATVKFYLH